MWLPKRTKSKSLRPFLINAVLCKARAVTLFLLYLYRYSAAVFVICLYKIPPGVTLSVRLYFFYKQKNLLSRQAYAFTLQHSSDKPRCESVEGEPCRKHKNYSFVYSYSHALLNEYFNRVTVGAFNFYKISDSSLSYQVHNLIKVYAFKCLISRDLRHVKSAVERSLY